MRGAGGKLAGNSLLANQRQKPQQDSGCRRAGLGRCRTRAVLGTSRWRWRRIGLGGYVNVSGESWDGQQEHTKSNRE